MSEILLCMQLSAYFNQLMIKIITRAHHEEVAALELYPIPALPHAGITLQVMPGIDLYCQILANVFEKQ